MKNSKAAEPAEESQPDTLPATSADEVVSGEPTCGMIQNTWSGLPHWQCARCGFTSLEQTEADRQAARCPAKKEI